MLGTRETFGEIRDEIKNDVAEIGITLTAENWEEIDESLRYDGVNYGCIKRIRVPVETKNGRKVGPDYMLIVTITRLDSGRFELVVNT